MLLGPVVGGLVDRGDRLRCAIAADVIRAGAFAGIVLVPSVRGPSSRSRWSRAPGTRCSAPPTSALLPELVGDRAAARGQRRLRRAAQRGPPARPRLRRPRPADERARVGPALNAATFAASALLLAPLRRLDSRRAPARRASPRGLAAAETAEGLRVDPRRARRPARWWPPPAP